MTRDEVRATAKRVVQWHGRFAGLFGRKEPCGERISRWALATQYGFEREIKWKPPMYTEMKVDPWVECRQRQQPSGLDGCPTERGWRRHGHTSRLFVPTIQHTILPIAIQGDPRFGEEQLRVQLARRPAFLNRWFLGRICGLILRANSVSPGICDSCGSRGTADFWRSQTQVRVPLLCSVLSDTLRRPCWVKSYGRFHRR